LLPTDSSDYPSSSDDTGPATDPYTFCDGCSSYSGHVNSRYNTHVNASHSPSNPNTRLGASRSASYDDSHSYSDVCCASNSHSTT